MPNAATVRFGLAGFLATGATVYYDNLFDAKGLGRVSDLIVARLNDASIDELRLRSLLTFAYFEAARCAAPSELVDPVVIEFGVDTDKVALSVSFLLPEIRDFQTEGFGARISRGEAQNALELLLARIYAQADGSAFSFSTVREQGAHRVEITAWIDRKAAASKADLQVRAVDGKEGDGPVPRTYVHLGDLPYQEMVPEVPVAPATAAQTASSTAAPKPSAAPDFHRRDILNTEKIVIKASPVVESDEVTVVKGEAPLPTGTSLIRRILDKFLAGKGSLTVSAAHSRHEETSEPLATVAPIQPPKFSPAAAPEPAPAESGSAESPVSALIAENPAPVADEAPLAGKTEDVRMLAQAMLTEVQSGAFARGIEKAQETARKISKQTEVPEVRAWLDSFTAELTSEKARMQDVANRIGVAVRRKEYELRTQEQLFAESLRQKEEAIAQKNTQLARMKEQLTAVKAKEKDAASASAEESQLRQKLSTTQRLLAKATDDCAKQTAKLEEVRAQSAMVAATQKSAEGTQVQELKAKNERLSRQYKQMKVMNEQIVKRMKREAEAEDDVASLEALQKKLDEATKKSAADEKERNMLVAKIEELQRGELRLMNELAQAKGKAKKAA